jgi:outer membrane protein
MMKKLFLVTLVGTFLNFFEPVWADTPDNKWIVRLRAIDVHPDGDSSVNGLTANAHVDNQIVPELDFTYFWTKNIATELILATSKHKVSTNTGIDLGSTWVLPPHLMMQYHFIPDSRFRPYVGAGLGYIFHYNNDAGAVNSIKYQDGISYAVQAGIDIGLNNKWAWNFDIKKMFYQTDVSVNGGAITADVDLNPWVIGTGLSYRF